MFTAALFITAKMWEQLKNPSTDEWINKMWYIHIARYYSATNKNKALIDATTLRSCVK